MPVPAVIEPVDDPLVQAYYKSWGRITAEFDQVVKDPLQQARSRRLQEILRSIARELSDLGGETEDWIANELPKAYAAGMSTGDVSAGELVWTQIHQQATQQIAQDLFDDLLKATKGVEASAKSLVQAVAKDEALAKAIESRTAQQAGKDMERILKQQGLYSVIYKDGSRHGIAEYAQVAIRSKTAVAYNTGTLNQHAGVQFFEVLDGPECGWSYHDDPTLALGLIVSREEAFTWPISHPNCRRSFGPRPDLEHREGVRTPDQTQAPSAGSVTDAQTVDQRLADEARRASKPTRTPKTQKTAKTGPTNALQAPAAPGGVEPTPGLGGRLGGIEPPGGVVPDLSPPSIDVIFDKPSAAYQYKGAHEVRVGDQVRIGNGVNIHRVDRVWDNGDVTITKLSRTQGANTFTYHFDKLKLVRREGPAIEEVIIGGGSDVAKLKAEVESLDVQLSGATARLKNAPGGRARAKIKAEIAGLEEKREANLAKIEELERALPPVVPPPVKPIVNPDQIPSVEEILKQHFGWTRPRAMREQMELRLQRVPDVATIRKSRPGWTTAVAERERTKLIEAITKEYPGIPVPKEFQFVPPTIKPKVPPKEKLPKPEPPKPAGGRSIPGGKPIRDRIAQYRANNEAELEKALGGGEVLTYEAHMTLMRAAVLDPEWVGKNYPDLFQWEQDRFTNRWEWKLPKPEKVTVTPEVRKAVDDAVALIRQLPPDKFQAYESGMERLRAAGVGKRKIENGVIHKWLEDRVTSADKGVNFFMKETGVRLDDKTQKTVDAARKWYARVMDKKLVGRRYQGRGAIGFGTTPESVKRAFYRSSSNTAYVGGRQSARVTVHEVGHGLENLFKGIDGSSSQGTWQRMAASFRNERAYGEELKEIYKGSGEMGYKDEFISHYMGKVYTWSDTEIISMGMEYMYADPVLFLTRDPEYFWFIAGLLAGDL